MPNEKRLRQRHGIEIVEHALVVHVEIAARLRAQLLDGREFFEGAMQICTLPSGQSIAHPAIAVPIEHLGGEGIRAGGRQTGLQRTLESIFDIVSGWTL